MSNQIGDRYTCSDPNCGCEIEVKSPCNMFDGRSPSATPVGDANSASARPTSTPTSELDSAAGDIRYGSNAQTFAPGSSSSLLGSGSSSNRVANSSLDPTDDLSGSDALEIDITDAVNALDDTTDSRFISMSLTCFCGSQMTQSESRNTAARAAGAS
ncbi:MAG TPA: hypothetical protein VK525_04025 [Candidatus Saccharimonadales bacterium]|nr:hypothetical protein [Candidatus Saccharimonadales bacterium]